MLKFLLLQLLPPQEKTDMFSSVRSAYTKAFTAMFKTSLQNVQDVESEVGAFSNKLQSYLNLVSPCGSTCWVDYANWELVLL